MFYLPTDITRLATKLDYEISASYLCVSEYLEKIREMPFEIHRRGLGGEVTQ